MGAVSIRRWLLRVGPLVLPVAVGVALALVLSFRWGGAGAHHGADGKQREGVMTQVEHYEQFLALHQQPEAFVMPNPWDGLSALIFKQAGFAALATSSAAFAATLGRRDGRHAVSAAEHLAHATLLIDVAGLPLNGDFEDGYGETPDDVAATVNAAIDAGLAGIGIEDTSGDPANPIRDFEEAVTRVAAAAKAGKGRIVLTGRTDNFIQGRTTWMTRSDA